MNKRALIIWWFMLVAVALIAGGLLAATTADSKEPPEQCWTVAISVASIDKFTKEKSLKAIAWLWQTSKPEYAVLYVMFPNEPEKYNYELYERGCRVANPRTGEIRSIADVTPQFIADLKTAEVVFDNGGPSPFVSY